jgi:flavorubredoxin
MKQAHCIYQNDDHRWLAIARDASKPGYLIDTNEYVVMDGEQALLCDPGGIEIFPAVFSALSAECDPTKLAGIFASHQDPDIISSLALWLEFKPDLKCYTSWLWQSFLPHFGGSESTFVPIPDPGMTIRLGSLELQAIPAHYLHSSGNHHLYDPKAKILFSGDVGAALLPPTRAACTSRISPATSATPRASTSAGWAPTGPSAIGASGCRGWRST